MKKRWGEKTQKTSIRSERATSLQNLQIVNYNKELLKQIYVT